MKETANGGGLGFLTSFLSSSPRRRRRHFGRQARVAGPTVAGSRDNPLVVVSLNIPLRLDGVGSFYLPRVSRVSHSPGKNRRASCRGALFPGWPLHRYGWRNAHQRGFLPCPNRCLRQGQLAPAAKGNDVIFPAVILAHLTSPGLHGTVHPLDHPADSPCATSSHP
jgi:hypothetical protein